MSWSLALINGDIGYGASGAQVVTDSNKLVQDLTCFILEPLGTDYINPDAGSVIDGGVDSTGQVYPSLIGGYNDSSAAALVQAEIQRICQDYQSLQIARNQDDLNTYGTSTLTSGEALLSLDGVDIQQVETNMLVSINITTGQGATQVAVGLGNN